MENLTRQLLSMTCFVTSLERLENKLQGKDRMRLLQAEITTQNNYSHAIQETLKHLLSIRTMSI